ncbi:SAM-dependent methyltransferase [Sphingomonas flavalba]|uniref:SAM-dependent methyltransferase n=1 Tax=Sphingomonas flavalba TaxID=2559804 RepID=UPI00109E22C1|nr:cyclopropane-fatty-acyl-phospholipid synthase family protein [Sphingomonas flavalba]
MSLLSHFLRRLVHRGELTVTNADGSVERFGAPEAGFPTVAIRFTDRGVTGAIARNPQLAAGEAFMDGRMVLEQGDILALLRLILHNAPWEGGGAVEVDISNPLLRLVDRSRAALGRMNWERRSKQNVAHHYDLSDDLYALFLDADRQYSCAYFTDPGNSLEQAQADKKAHIAAKLNLKPGNRVLDIGCGWGGMALYLARAVEGVSVLGITLSEEQLKVARRRAEEAGLADRVRFELRDYRRVEERFDRIVSVGMFEHVGPPNYLTFFRKCREILADDGAMLLHTIGRLGLPGQTDPWTRKYIFPGGYCPSLSEIVSASEKAHLIATDVENLRLHYAYTIQHWYDRATANRAAIVALYDERFFRMWQFYLAGSLVAFEAAEMCNYQIQYARRRTALPITRDYMAQAEARLPR